MPGADDAVTLRCCCWASDAVALLTLRRCDVVGAATLDPRCDAADAATLLALRRFLLRAHGVASPLDTLDVCST